MANTTPAARPVIFVGSSSEGLQLAKAVQVLLDRNNDVELWTQGVFGLSHGTLESLVDAIPGFDFAILILTADDLVISRGTEQQTARDNVLLELGLFMGGLGRDRTFIIYERGTSLKLPSDLAGVTPATFQMQASGNLQASLGAPCTQIEQAIQISGIRAQRYTPALEIDCTRAPGRIGGRNTPRQNDVYMKFRVQNTHQGTVARNCRAHLFGIHQVKDTGEVVGENLLPDSVQLAWEGGDFEPRDIPSAHPHGIHSQYGDIVHFSKREGDEGWWIFQTKLPIGRKQYSGVYQFKIIVFGDNMSSPAFGTINIDYRGDWRTAELYDAPR
jgi:Predicted nucleotide-binding protein containing TIR-like domain